MGEWILIGSKQPLQVDPANLQRRMTAAALAPDLAKLEISSAADLLALYLKGQEFVNDYTAGVPPVTDDRSVVDYTIPRQARANFGLGDFTTGGFYVSAVGPNGLVSELRVRDFDAIYTMRDSADSLVAPASPQNRNAFTDELARRRLEAERRCGQKIAWNATAMAADFWLLGQREKSFQALDSGIGIVDPAAKVDLLLSKASLFRRNGQLAEARETARKALVIEPSNSQALKFVSELNR
jgi:tetratricopeptide (TPR) repeat protein